ncbi:MFS transporter [Actinokineospora bangkokensis]|uniref:MFS transporter n=1 Tax=Actinokineospora bangkokensis TaxID=1193682 RepID=A0A1Q9LL05_9PSEU|nr:MFS transporter [Actinokineospora bangkokensis]OLR92674.1 MFS transporter [Actinokineospora bangkokensis]
MTAVRSEPAAPVEAARAPGHGSPRAALTAAVLGFFVITLDVSGVNVALPSIRDDLNGTLSGLQWVADAYTLMFAALMLSAGVLSDRVGAKRAYGWGLAAFTLASVACGIAPDLGFLVGARVVQGCAAAIMVPSSLALIRQAFPDPVARARGIALWTVGGAVAVAAGPVLGGLLTTEWDWRVVFALNVPAGVAGFLFLLRAERSPRHETTFDVPGQVTAVLALAALTFAVIQGGHGGFTPTVIAAVAVAVLSGAAFVLVESRRRDPMLPLGMFRQKGVSVPVISGFACNAAFYGGVFILSLFFQEQRGQSALSAGLMFAPMALITANFNYLSPKFVQRFGPRAVIVAGLLVGAVGCGGLMLVRVDTPWWITAALMVPLGIGGSLAMPALTTLMLDTVANERAGTAAAMLNTSRQAGGAISIAVFGVLLAGDFATGMRTSLALAGGLLVVMALMAVTVLPRGKATT